MTSIAEQLDKFLPLLELSPDRELVVPIGSIDGPGSEFSLEISRLMAERSNPANPRAAKDPLEGDLELLFEKAFIHFPHAWRIEARIWVGPGNSFGYKNRYVKEQ